MKLYVTIRTIGLNVSSTETISISSKMELTAIDKDIAAKIQAILSNMSWMKLDCTPEQLIAEAKREGKAESGTCRLFYEIHSDKAKAWLSDLDARTFAGWTITPCENVSLSDADVSLLTDTHKTVDEQNESELVVEVYMPRKEWAYHVMGRNVGQLHFYNIPIHESVYKKVGEGKISSDGTETIEQLCDEIFGKFGTVNAPAISDWERPICQGDVIVLSGSTRCREAYFLNTHTADFVAASNFFDAQPTHNTTVSESTNDLVVRGYPGTWKTVEMVHVNGKNYFHMECSAQHEEIWGSHPVYLIVDEHGNEVMYDPVGAGFTDEVKEELQLHSIDVFPMPDATISQSEMRNGYGYEWWGMLPVRPENAKNCRCQVYMLYNDNTESALETEEEFQHHVELGGIFGVEKESWIHHLKNIMEETSNDTGK